MLKKLLLLSNVIAWLSMHADMQDSIQRLVQECQDKDIKFVDYRFIDFCGTLKSITRPISYLAHDLQASLPCDGSSIIGCTRITNSDIELKPDLNSVMMLPWTYDHTKTMRIMCDMYLTHEMPYTADPRYILKRTLQRAYDELDAEFVVGPELEYYVFECKDDNFNCYDQGTYFNTPHGCKEPNNNANILTTLLQMGIPVEKIHHEVGPGQYEISIKYDNALIIADHIINAKDALISLGKAGNLHVSFMPKPLYKKAGNGMHIHFSLRDRKTKKNLFYDKDDSHQLSMLGRSFIAGVLNRIDEFTLLCNSTINSGKRLIPGFEAPTQKCCGIKNRSALIRLPYVAQDQPQAIRAELRSPDPMCNPYLVFAALLQAGLEGIKNNEMLPELITDNVYELSTEELKARNIGTIPSTLEEAIACAEKSEFMQNLLGERLFTEYIAYKKHELLEFRKAVTDWEVARYR